MFDFFFDRTKRDAALLVACRAGTCYRVRTVNDTSTDVSKNSLFPSRGLVAVPVSSCLICGAERDPASKDCARCGATDADVRSVLSAGANAYSQARAQAIAGRFEEARESLQVAASLGLRDAVAWRELSELVNTMDPPVAAPDAKRYLEARELAERGQFLGRQLLTMPDTPVTRELSLLCATGAALQKRQIRSLAFRYMFFGAMGVVLAVWLLPHPMPTMRKENSVRAQIDARKEARESPVLAQKVYSPGDGTEKAVRATYPYPERLARRYYNDALTAYRAEDYRTAARLVDLATDTSNNRDILPHTLLLRAQIADTLGDAHVAQLWARIATNAPRSPYAPLGLLRAAQRAKRNNKEKSDVALYLRRLIHEYPSSRETAVARKQFYPILVGK